MAKRALSSQKEYYELLQLDRPELELPWWIPIEELRDELKHPKNMPFVIYARRLPKCQNKGSNTE
jgi:hypothetical protein